MSLTICPAYDRPEEVKALFLEYTADRRIPSVLFTPSKIECTITPVPIVPSLISFIIEFSFLFFAYLFS